MGLGVVRGSHPSGRVHVAAATQCSLDGEVAHAGFTYRLYCQLLSGLFPVFFCAARKTLQGVVGLLTCSFSRAWVLPLHRAQEEHQPVAKSSWDFPGRAIREESAYQYRRSKRRRFNPWVRKIPWRRKWQPTPVFLPGKSHGQRSLADYSPWGRKELDTTEHPG